MGYRIINIDPLPTSFVGGGTFGTTVASNTLTAPITIKSFQLDASDDEYITVFAEFFIQSFASTNFVAQAIPLIVNIGSGNTKTVNVRPPFLATNTSTAYSMVVPITLTATSRNGDLITCQVGAANAVDAGTFVNITSFKIVAESGTRTGT